MGIEQSGEKKIGIVELSKNVDKAGFYGGMTVYLLAGIPFALAIAALSAGSWGVTVGGEKLVRKWTSKFKGQK